MWWLCVTFVLLPTATQQGEAYDTGPPVEMALVGYDPLMMNVMGQPDQGRKSTIFIPWKGDPIYTEKKEDLLNSFVDAVQQTRCYPSLTESIVRNHEAYKSLSSGVVSFDTESSATTPLGASQFNFKEKAGYGNLNNPNDVLLRDFFNRSEGEGRFIKVECVSHTVRILPFQKPVFTTAFESALQVLHQAALDTNSVNKKDTFSRFVRTYGTHFARTTQFGYAAYYGKLFTSQTKTHEEEAVRRSCMLESAKETLTPIARGECETMSQHVYRAAPGRCSGEVLELMIPGIGSASTIGLGECNLVENVSPRPVAYVLEKISALFEEDWFSSVILETKQVRLDGTALTAYFEEQTGEYSQDVIERAETTSRNLCPWKRYITPNMTDITAVPTEGEVKSSSAGNGGIIIVGGLPSATSNSSALFMLPPPLFPVEVSGNTLSIVGNAVYSCGGGDDNKKCWHIETGTSDTTWDPFDIPWALQHHSAVVVQDDIWFFSNSKLRILHTRNTPKKFHEINLLFNVGEFICAVSHGSQIFVLGVGEGGNEVHVNNNASKPEQWKRFSHLLQGRSRFGCLVYDAEILVTGGWVAANKTRLSSAEAISVVDGTVRSLGPLGGARNDHKMALIQDRPAVLGGHGVTAALATIETYDKTQNSWNVLGYSLNEPRHSFGLAQFRP